MSIVQFVTRLLTQAFENFSWREFTWRREPVLYLTLLVAVLQVVLSVLSDGVGVQEGIETVVMILAGFLARGQVEPWEPAE